ncbi:hypothetical protein FB451DRAFT_1169687 [Mycena latifolia]|nr:hypothetical protein FB451DRAFT_1169687 [Mycena latifolia]
MDSPALGYGGGVAASRMARAGKTVAVLELGSEKWPGEYPSDLKDALPELHVSGNAGRFSGPLEDVAVGKATGLYHLVLGEGQNAFVGNGLGGTSLLNANVFLEADKRTLQLNNWPEEIRKDSDCLDPYYARAAEMLQPTPYPEDYPPLEKLQVLEKQAKALGHGDNFYRVPQTTFFHDGLNNVGVEMKASTGSGQDCTGVNDGSKHSVLMNYLPDAWNWGAEIFCECEVRYIHKTPGNSGYTIFFAWHGDGRNAFEDDFYTELMWVRAKELCFLGAGALGTTEILLRSKVHGLKMSRFVGQKLSGNGDILSFGYNTDEIVNGIGRLETSPNVLDGYVLEEGAIPQALAPIIQSVLEVLPGKEHPAYTAAERIRHLFSSIKTSNEGIVTFENDKPYLQFLGVGRTKHVKRLNEILANATKTIGGTLINSPFYSAFHQREEITVHPLGGAIISSDGTGRNGATNHVGQLFTGEGTEVHEGLVCVDGSVIPTALGVNPFATITALAERSVDLIANNDGLTVNTSKNGRLNLFGKPARSFAVDPRHGYGEQGDPIRGSFRGSHRTPRLRISRNRTFSCGALSKDPMLILRGEVQFFTIDDTVSDGHNLVYKLTLLSTDGETYLMTGHKNVDSNIAFSVSNTWKATTTLFTTITRLDGSMVGRGRLHVSWRNFGSELRSLGPTGDGLFRRSILPSFRFLGYFAQNLANYFLGPLSRLEYPDRNHTGYFCKAPPAQIITLTAKDGIQTTMKVWIPDDNRDPVDIVKKNLPILMIPGASVDDQIFSLPTIPTNTVEYFTSRGYTVYVPTLRFGRTPAAEKGYTVYDTRLDVAAAMNFVHEQHGGKMYILCHCVGAIVTSMGLLDGTLPPEWIQGLTASQVFFRQHFSFDNAIKAQTSVLTNIYRLLGGPWFPAASTPTGPSLFQLLVDQLLRFYPVGPSAELCNSTVCHRCSLVFGRLWNHANLTHATHAHLINFFGGIHLDMLTHLMRTGTAGHSLDDAGNNLVTDTNLARLQGIPMLFLSGGDNVVFDPVSTSMNYDDMREKFGPALYRRAVVSGYGHLDTWMGKRSKDDVYPIVREHLEWCEGLGNGILDKVGFDGLRS